MTTEMPETLAFLMLAMAMTFATIRLIRGPSLVDRVVALDLFAIIVAGFLTVYAIETNQQVYLDVAIVQSLFAFLGTVAFAQYLERRARDE